MKPKILKLAGGLALQGRKSNPGLLKILAAVVLASLLMPQASGAQSLGPDGLYYQCFVFTGDNQTWAGAYAEALTQTLDVDGVTEYGYLAPVATSDVSDFVNTLIQDTPYWGSWAIAWNGNYVNNGIVYAGAQGEITDTSWMNWSGGSTPAITVGQPGDYGVTTTGDGYGYAWQTRDPSFDGIGGYVVAFSTTPIPEPSTPALAGLSGLGLLRFRRRQ
ncbi:MAG: PEP-CTERM sorting domain-containing protein [Verrucomicrobiota bacterium]|jgi:hypothetical protein